MEVDPGSALPLIDKSLKECSKSVCRMVHVMKRGKEPDRYVWLAYKEIQQRYSRPLICNNPVAVIFITAERVARQPTRKLEPAPIDFRERFEIRIADDQEEMIRWIRVQELINRAVRPRLWPVAALLYDDSTELGEERFDDKLDRIAQMLNEQRGRTADLIANVKKDIKSSREGRRRF